MSIVRAMKPTTRRIIPCACAGVFVMSFAALAGAQAPASQPAPSQGAVSAPAAPPAPPAPPPLSKEQASYLFGLTFGESLRGIGVGNDVLQDAVVRGMKEGLAGKKASMPEKQQLQDFARQSMTALGVRNKTAAEEFLAKNGKEKGVQTTASGLQYKVIKAGDDKAPLIGATDEVTVNYRGKLLDGSEFDSSYSRGQPATFPANGVIKGWQEALVMMKPGAVWELYVPPDLAYGSNPRPGIPANSLLTFNIEVLSSKPRPASGVPVPPPGQRPGMPPPPSKPQ
jgi:FKBP-type peptidyl-prolyl cis-trans isomerase FklB